MKLKDKISYAVLITSISIALIFYATPIQILSTYGTSMTPTIKTGDAVIIFPTDFQEIRVGDIITFKQEGLLITHRVHNFENGMIKTKGDGLSEKDPYLIGPSDVKGKLLLVIPHGGTILKHVNSTIGFILLILTPAVMIIYRELRKIIDKKYSNRKKVNLPIPN